MIIERNNTSFAVKVYEQLKKTNFTELDFLRYHQNVLRWFVNSIDCGSRGLLCAHEMGTGKTMVGAAVAFDALAAGYKVIFLTTKSLAGNMSNTVTKYIVQRAAQSPDWQIDGVTMSTLQPDAISEFVSQNFSFVSSNASNMVTALIRAAEGKPGAEYAKVVKKVAEPEQRIEAIVANSSLENHAIIVDEAHNLFRAITNGSQNALLFYKMVMKTKRIKLFWLTGTPIATDPFELVPALNMLVGYDLLPTDYVEFRRLFVGANGIINKSKFQNRIQGLVSRVTADVKPGKTIKPPATNTPDVKFPTILPRVIHLVHMTDTQYAAYSAARDKETDEASRAYRNASSSPLTKPKNQASSSYRQQSRQLSNFCPPAEYRSTKFGNIDAAAINPIESPKYDKVLEIIDGATGLGYVYSQFVGAGGLASLAAMLNQHGYSIHPLQKHTTSLAAEDRVEGGSTPMPTKPVNLDEFRAKFEATDWWKTHYLDTIPGEELADWLTPTDDVVPRFSAPVIPDAPRGTVRSFWALPIDPFTGAGEVHLIDGKAFANVSSADAARSAIEYATANGVTSVFGPAEYFPIATADPTIGMQYIGGTERSKTYAVCTGAIDPAEREQILAIYNSPENAHGELISLLLFSATGAEGLDLKNQRYGIVLEPYWTAARINQVERRGARANSHIQLPSVEQTFQLHVLLAVKPTTHPNVTIDELTADIPPEKMTTDVELYTDSNRSAAIIESFQTALYETSIECMVNDGQCKTCAPTDEMLFFTDVTTDMEMPDPCKPYTPAEIRAKTVMLNDKTYKWTDGPTFYDYNADLDAWTEIPKYTLLHSELSELV